MRLCILLLLSFVSIYSRAQQKLTVKVKDAASKSPITASVLVKGTNKGYATDTLGIAVISFPSNGNYILVTTAVGYQEKETKLSIPFASDTFGIELESAAEEMEEVVVQSDRNGNYILVTTAVGYQEKETKLSIPFASDTFGIELESAAEEMEEVVVQ